MFRFVALAWNPSDDASEQAVSRIRSRLDQQPAHWEVSLALDGLTVLLADGHTGSSTAIPLSGGNAVVLGTLFDRHSTACTTKRVLSLDAAESQAIVRSEGRHLVEGYWGRYVAILFDPATDSTRVLRDPTGALPCFTANIGRVRIFFSYAQDIAELGMMRVSINWTFVAAHLYRPRFLNCAQTGLDDIREILPGECWEVRDHRPPVRHVYWSPVAIARSGHSRNVITQLHETTLLCVSAWASCFRRILHLLSGGLDSSVVLRCMRACSPQTHVTALTFFNAFSSAADEREFARLAAQATECELLEVEEDPADAKLEVLLTATPSVKPWDMQYYQTHGQYERRVSATVSANAVFDGSGGDHLFFQGPIVLTARDYGHDHGVGSALMRLSSGIAHQQGLSFWSVLSEGVRGALSRRKWSHDTHIRKMRLTTPEVEWTARRSRLLEPSWLSDAAALPWGKVEHIRMSSVPHDFYNPFSRSAIERVSPLISQPLVELCLRTPVYWLSYGGIDRFAERQAFQQELPNQIVWRRTKGSSDAYLQRLLVHNLRFARELMLDGELVRRGLLDRAKVERALSSSDGALWPEAAEIMVFHLSTESWLQGVKEGWRPHMA